MLELGVVSIRFPNIKLLNKSEERMFVNAVFKIVYKRVFHVVSVSMRRQN